MNPNDTNRTTRRIATLFILTLLVPLVAGCVDGHATDVDGGSGPSEQTAHPYTPVAMPQDRHGSEPNIAVMADGTIFVTGQAGFVPKANVAEGAAWLWRSQDDGETWEVLRSPDYDNTEDASEVPGRVRCSCDADVVVSPDGWVYYTDWWTGYTLAGNFLVERSSDGGETWTATPVTIPRDGWHTIDRQWLLPGADGFLALFYHHWDPVDLAVHNTGARIEVVISHDHGVTWSLPITVVGETGAAYHAQAHPLMLPDGTLVMPHASLYQDGTCDWMFGCEGVMELPAGIHVALSSDQGATWRNVPVADVPEGVGAGLPIGAAADASGRILIAYNAWNGDEITVYTTESPDGGQTWTPPEAIQAGGSQVLPWVAATPDGRFAVAWYAADFGGDPEDAPEDTAWHVQLAERTAADAPWTVTRLTESPVVEGPACFTGDLCSIARPLADFLSLTYGPDGAIHVAYAIETTFAPVMIGPFEAAPERTIGHVRYVQVPEALE